MVTAGECWTNRAGINLGANFRVDSSRYAGRLEDMRQAGRSPAPQSEMRYFAGCKVSFCTRQFKISATYSSFSDGHAIS